jgi:hypothetical protein
MPTYDVLSGGTGADRVTADIGGTTYTGEWSGPADPEEVAARQRQKAAEMAASGATQSQLEAFKERGQSRIDAAQTAQTTNAPGTLYHPEVTTTGGGTATLTQRTPGGTSGTGSRADVKSTIESGSETKKVDTAGTRGIVQSIMKAFK